jgi:hypothetical protein
MKSIRIETEYHYEKKILTIKMNGEILYEIQNTEVL